jgi:peptidoglycan/xylan/chitin deacetylase (PgdA/CDA1 family)
VSRELHDAILLSFDNLGEAADLERGTARGPIGDDPSVAVGLPRALDALAARDLRATFFVEGLNAELYPQALRDIAAAGHEVGLHGWRHEVWDALTPGEEDERLGRGVAAFDGLGLAVEGFRPPGGRLGPRTFEALARHGLRWCSPAGERPGRTAGIACLPFHWPAVDAYHRLESFTGRRTSWGDRAAVASPREAADALIGALDARGDDLLVLILHPFLMLSESEAAEARRVLGHVADLVARGERWVAPGRELAALVGDGSASNVGPTPS